MTMILQRQEIDRFRDFVAREFGLNVDDGDRDRLIEAFERGVARTRCTNKSLYVCRLNEGTWPKVEQDALIDDLTVPETYFFRHPDQFRVVLERVIQNRLAGGSSQTRLRMLSAGCASGEEAYSLAMLISDHLPQSSDCDVEVLGIDINSRLLAKAARGRYTAWSLRGVPDDVPRRHFRKEGPEFVLNESIRAGVTFSECNLNDDDPEFWRPDLFDVIFCRNVIMYFTPQAGQSVIARLTRSLSPGGFLFLGPAETLRGMTHNFHLEHTHGTFYYQRRLTEHDKSRFVRARESVVEPTNSRLSTTADVDESWVTTICRASDRITLLSRYALAANSTIPDAKVEPCRPPGVTDPSHRLGAARQLVLEEQFDEALRVLQALPGNAVDSPDVQLLRAVVLTNTGRVQQAERLCQSVIDDDELNAEAHYVLALCREHTGVIDEAIEHDQTAIYLDPRFAMPHLHLALVLKRMGDQDSANQEFCKAAMLLAREDPSRIVLFGGGFGRESLARLCHVQLGQSGGAQ